MQALEGITVLDLVRGYPPSQCSMMLGDFGARVIRVDSPEGNKMEKQAGIDSHDERFSALNRLNRNKEAIVINMRSEEGLKVFYRLAKKADVLVEGFRPGVMKRLKADFETLKEINPRLVYCAVSSYGATGPYARMAGHDPCNLGVAGALSMVGPRNGTPIEPSNYIADMGGAAMHGLAGILIALLARERTGRGQFIDISYTDAVLSLMEYDLFSYFFTGVLPMRGETTFTGAPASSHVYQCKDGKYMVVACGELQFWDHLCRAIGREDLIAYHPAPQPEQEKCAREMAKIFLTRDRDEWWEFLKDKDTCVAPVNDISEGLKDPQILHRQMVLELDHPRLGKIRQVGNPIKLSETPAQVRSLGKPVGADTLKIMAELGYSKEDMEKLEQAGTIGT
jgi:crotonobetainyl-CoA:carnitine CoA-transferase CaiB-like acyl-CoA transferase